MKSPRRWLWFLLLAVPLVVGLARLRFDVEVLNLLPSEVPAVQGLKLYQQHFSNARELIITVRGKDADTTEAAARELAEKLRAQPTLVGSVTWQAPWLEHPGEMAELLAYLWLNQPPEVFGALTNRLEPKAAAEALATAREQLATTLSPDDIARLGYDPFSLTRLPDSVMAAAPSMNQGTDLFSSEDGTFRILFVQARQDLTSYRLAAAWLTRVKAIAAAQSQAGVTFRFTGGPAFVSEIAGGMEHDMTESVLLTAVIIAILFWIAHRRWVPMLWLLTLLALILLGTLALGGLIFTHINVVSLGFAAILLGLAVDYGVVHYQEALASPDATIPEIRRAIGPSIFWAAVTTISAFFVLNFGGLPGLAQLGSLVAIGVALSAVTMLFAFLPPLFRDRAQRRHEQQAAGKSRPQPVTHARSVPPSPTRAFVVTALLIAAAFACLLRGLPVMDQTANALRPRNSPAYAALDEMKSVLTHNRDPLWVVAADKDVTALGERLSRVERVLQQAATNQAIAGFTLPSTLWPDADHQARNRAAAAELASRREPLRAAVLAGGFSTNAFALTDRILNTWEAAASKTSGVFWPTNEMSRWIFNKVIARETNQLLVVGFLYPATNATAASTMNSAWARDLSREGFMLSGWELLGSAILGRVQGNLWLLVAPMVGLVLASLWFAFRRWQEIGLSLAVLLLSGLGMLAVMNLMGWSWNLLNLMALPLIMGTGVDYSIFMQLALRRHQGDQPAAHASVGRALLLCGGTAVAGFGSLGLSTNAGMASLGQICAIGVGSNMLISIYLLPAWWQSLVGRHPRLLEAGGTLAQPSRLYQEKMWRLGLWVGRSLPASVADALGRILGRVYGATQGERFEIVKRNLLPVFQNDQTKAAATAGSLFANFGQKLADLWRYESGLPVDHLFGELTGWDHFCNAQARGRGVLLVTPHLGNWEFGAPLLAKRGVKLLVITLAEPGHGLTEMRQASRARWGIETLVIGENPFAFVEIIKRLEAGAVVALLVDRPPAASAVTVELFGRPFAASIAAAELARASGCALLPVYLPRNGSGYSAHILPEVAYDRANLSNREARQQLTQQILRAFEPAIRQHADQWYHFVSVWM